WSSDVCCSDLRRGEEPWQRAEAESTPGTERRGGANRPSGDTSLPYLRRRAEAADRASARSVFVQFSGKRRRRRRAGTQERSETHGETRRIRRYGRRDGAGGEGDTNGDARRADRVHRSVYGAPVRSAAVANQGELGFADFGGAVPRRQASGANHRASPAGTAQTSAHAEASGIDLYPFAGSGLDVVAQRPRPHRHPLR